MQTTTPNILFVPSVSPITELKRIDGGVGVDDRGQVLFINGFDFAGVKRMYLVRNHAARFVRAWHAHQREGKYVTVLQGAAIIGAVRVEDVTHPDPNARVERFTVSAARPAVIAIPPGYANGAMSLTDDAIIAYFSTATLEESAGDDYRYDARFWDAWSVEER